MQDTPRALALLVAQRAMYNRAKRWAAVRSFGFSFIAIAAPIASAVHPGISISMGAISGAWIFTSRTLIVQLERRRAAKGAEIQEQFDQYVFGMPHRALREPHVNEEELSDLAGHDITSTANQERLKNWYSIDSSLPGEVSVALAQRANAAYSERLLNANATIWFGVTVAWSLVAVIVGVVSNEHLADFLLGIALPLLPALLDVIEQLRSTRQAGRERRAIADGIERVVMGDGGRSLTPEDLLVWQDQLYELRRSAPQVPNLLYQRLRTRNERAMNAATEQLSQRYKSTVGR